MKTREYYQGKDTREAILRVAAVLGNTIGATLGPGGRNYLTTNGITNDGKTIIREMEFEDSRENLIADIIKVVPERTDNEVGDGTTTSVVLATRLIEDVLPRVVDISALVPGTVSAMDIMRELEEEKNKAISLLEQKKRPIASLEDLEKVAITSMEDAVNAKIVAKALYEGGKDSSLVIDEGFSGKVEAEVVSGIKTPLTLATPTSGKREITLQNVPVVVAMHIFEEYKELGNFMSSMMQALATPERPSGLVIVGKQFSVPFIQEVMNVSRESKFPILLISNSEVEKSAFEDIAAYCGAKLIDTHPKGGAKISSLNYSHAGKVKKIVAGNKGTLFVEGAGTKIGVVASPVQVYVMDLQKELETEKVEERRQKLQLRIAELLGGIVTLRVDAPTAAEKFYLKLKIQDAMNSCKNALEGGMIRGGGTAMKEVADELGADSILHGALSEPYRLIQRNRGPFEIGEGVEDAYNVVKVGLESAVSVVKVLVSCEGVIAPADPNSLEMLKNTLSTPSTQ